MKALTLTQPWATLVAVGAKRLETRSWYTRHRGWMAIHAAKGFPRWAKDMCLEPAFAEELGPNNLPTGVVLATCRLISCIPTEELQENRVIELDSLTAWHFGLVKTHFVMTDEERRFGDYSPGRWAWLLADVTRLNEPMPAKGSMGLWEWEKREQ